MLEQKMLEMNDKTSKELFKTLMGLQKKSYFLGGSASFSQKPFDRQTFGQHVQHKKDKFTTQVTVK
jgi:hypothetical protein